MLLAVDISNTTVTIGLFDRSHLRERWQLQAQVGRTVDEYGLHLWSLSEQVGVDLGEVQGAIIASVVPSLTPIWRQICADVTGQQPLVVGAGIKTGLRIRREAPRQLGADRVACAVAANSLFQRPLCIVDFGTAITFDALDETGDYVGHAIAPGLEMAAAALGEGAAQLPEAPLLRPEHAIGRNTVEGMQVGLVFGYVGLVEGLIERFREELGQDMQVIATGRHAQLIAAETSLIQQVEPVLVLIGLRMIWELNQ